TGVLFGVGALSLLVWMPRGRRLLAGRGPWIAVVIAIIFQAPALAWNIDHDWASLGLQSGRAFASSLDPQNLLAVLLGQAAFLLPWSWALAMFTPVRGIVSPRMPAERVFAVLA